MSSNNLARVEAQARAELVSDVEYSVDLDLTGDRDTFRSQTTVRFTCARPGASTFLDLIAPSVQRIEVNGSAVPGAFDGSRVRLDGLQGRNEVVVVADCSYMRTGSGLHRFVDPVDGRPYLHTQFEPFDAHRVLACFDQPDVKATFELTVAAPDDWTCVANTVPQRSGGRWSFPATPRISTYLMALVAGPFHEVRSSHRSIDLGLYCRLSLARHLDVDNLLEVTRQGLDYYEKLFDYPYPFGKYDQLFVPEFSAGAMENVGCVTFNESYVFRSKITEQMLEGRANTILHEMAHMWFGDLVTMRWWDDLWLNESFATYMATLAIVEATRFTGGWARFTQGTKTAAYAQDQLPTTHAISADIPDTEATRTHFDAITYQKGASVLRQLAAWVGRDAFDGGLRRYFPRHEWGNASLTDFLAPLEETSGRDLAAWSREWLETAGVNTLRPVVTTKDGTYESVSIAQESPPLRSHRTAIGLYALDGGMLRRRTRVELDVTGSSTPVPGLAGQPVADLLLVNDDDLAYAKIRLDDRSLETILERLSAVEDPLARALCWASAWDMVRDAETPTRRYVALVAEHAHLEADLATVSRLVGQASNAVDMYGDPANRATSRAVLAARAREQLGLAVAGSDAQLTWARMWIGNADGAADELRAILDGPKVIDGLAVDTDLRWSIVAMLAANGDAGDDLVDAELDRDRTDIGARRAAAAKASMPRADAKQHAWTSVLDDHTLPLATIRSIAGSLHQPAQDALLLPYVDRYVDALPAIWSGRDPDVALALTRGLYPGTIVDRAVVAATDRGLALDLPRPARRTLIEGKDRIERAVRARAADRPT